MESEFVLFNIGELITLAPLVSENRWTEIKHADLGIKHNAWLHIANQKIKGFGEGDIPSHLSSLKTLDLQQKLVMPGFVDSHTHPCFAGDRSEEFCQKLEGATYQEIANKGGGIKKTVAMTAVASVEELAAITKRHLDQFLRFGVTTIEAKSGYGLTVESELKMLEAIRLASKMSPQTIEPTCLALHAMPDTKLAKADFIQQMTNELLPEVKNRGLANWVDAFIEEGYFTPKECEPFFRKAQDLGLGIRLHVDEFKDHGGGVYGASLNAASCDHLEYTSEKSMKAMSEASVVATLLPGTSLYSKIPYADGRSFARHEVKISLATDFNPGSCLFANIGFIAGIGALHCGLSLAETIAAITWVPAYSLRLSARKGALVSGMDADFVVIPETGVAKWLSHMGQTLPEMVYIGGKKVWETVSFAN